ncbi:MAG: hypothetical protein ACLGIO_14240 [Acidimicrobiia bacterium]
MGWGEARQTPGVAAPKELDGVAGLKVDGGAVWVADDVPDHEVEATVAAEAAALGRDMSRAILLARDRRRRP